MQLLVDPLNVLLNDVRVVLLILGRIPQTILRVLSLAPLLLRLMHLLLVVADWLLLDLAYDIGKVIVNLFRVTVQILRQFVHVLALAKLLLCDRVLLECLLLVEEHLAARARASIVARVIAGTRVIILL